MWVRQEERLHCVAIVTLTLSAAAILPPSRRASLEPCLQRGSGWGGPGVIRYARLDTAFGPWWLSNGSLADSPAVDNTHVSHRYSVTPLLSCHQPSSLVP